MDCRLYAIPRAALAGGRRPRGSGEHGRVPASTLELCEPDTAQRAGAGTSRPKRAASGRGELRQWTNGNLHAFVEPTQNGYRLRLGTLKGDAVPVNLLGTGGILMSAVMAAAAVLTGGVYGDVGAAVVLGSMGAGAFGFNALRLPRWARERERQMEYIAERARALIGAAPEPEPERDVGS